MFDKVNLEYQDKSFAQCEALLVESLTTDVAELDGKCEIFTQLSQAAFQFADTAMNATTFKVERYLFEYSTI